MGKTKFTLVMTYVIEFTVCSFIGWLYEEGLELVINHSYSDRGILHLPLLPIYGFGGLLLMLFYRKKDHSAFYIFFTSMLITTALELAASYPLEWILGYIPWYYGGWFLNFEGRIALVSSVIFGLMGILLVKAVHPFCRKLERSPAAAVNTAGIICALAFVIDLSILLLV